MQLVVRRALRTACRAVGWGACGVQVVLRRGARSAVVRVVHDTEYLHRGQTLPSRNRSVVYDSHRPTASTPPKMMHSTTQHST